MKLINLTPHDVHIVEPTAPFGCSVRLPRSGSVARAVEDRRPFRPLVVDGGCASAYDSECGSGMDVVPVPHHDVPVTGVRYEGLSDLPAPADGVGYVVSVLTALAARACGRPTGDLYYPGEMVRDGSGVILGCTGLYQLVDHRPVTQILI